jgi:hypothetical protein
MTTSGVRIGRKHSRGVALIILMTILAMGMLYFLTEQMGSANVWQRAANSNNGSTNVALTQAREALIGYAITYRDNHPSEVFGYLPCPDRDGDGDADPNMDGFCETADGKAEIGLLPYKTLGLPDLRDTEGNCLWYAVASKFKASLTTPVPMNWDTQGQFSILDSDGTPLVAAPDSINGEGGAAAIVFAAGSPVGSQSRHPTGTYPCRLNMRSVKPDTSTNPTPTSASDFLDSALNLAATTIAITRGIIGSSTNNDQLIWITPKQIFDRIKKRSDFVTAINTLSSALVTALTPTIPGAALTVHDSATLIGTTKSVGKFPAATGGAITATNFATTAAAYTTYQNNWRDMYRYVRCTPSSPSNKCLTVNGQHCMGTLIFSGQNHAATGPRTSTDLANDATYIDPANYSAYSTMGSYTFSGDPSFNIADTTKDVLYCLNSPDTTETSITGTAGFSATAGSASLVSNFATSGTLGDTTSPASDASGCAWNSTAVDFLNGLRVYFKLTILTRDSGLTFVMADTTNNPSTTNLCGGGGKYLGYASTDVSTGNTIKPPKIGLELDTRRGTTIETTDINVSTSNSGRHAAFVYWGTLGTSPTYTYDDDNTHGAGTAASDTQPKNPQDGESGIATQAFNVSTVAAPIYYHVRLDINRSYPSATAQGIYVMKAYIYPITSSTPFTSCHSWLSDLSDDLSNLDATCTANISNTITLNDSLTAGNEAMKKVFLGFTTGQRSGRTQNLTIGNFAAKTH